MNCCYPVWRATTSHGNPESPISVPLRDVSSMPRVDLAWWFQWCSRMFWWLPTFWSNQSSLPYSMTAWTQAICSAHTHACTTPHVPVSAQSRASTALTVVMDWLWYSFNIGGAFIQTTSLLVAALWTLTKLYQIVISLFVSDPGASRGRICFEWVPHQFLRCQTPAPIILPRWYSLWGRLRVISWPTQCCFHSPLIQHCPGRTDLEHRRHSSDPMSWALTGTFWTQLETPVNPVVYLRPLEASPDDYVQLRLQPFNLWDNFPFIIWGRCPSLFLSLCGSVSPFLHLEKLPWCLSGVHHLSGPLFQLLVLTPQWLPAHWMPTGLFFVYTGHPLAVLFSQLVQPVALQPLFWQLSPWSLVEKCSNTPKALCRRPLLGCELQPN